MTRPPLPFRALVAAIATTLLLGPISTPAPAQAPSSRMTEVEGDSMHVRTAGFEHLENGQPVVVFQLGGFSSIDTWDPVFADVAAFAPAVAYERRGIGQSEWDGKPQTPGRVAAQLKALLEEVQAPPPYILVGHSWGGWLIRHFAGRYPEEVAGLVYIDPTDFTRSRADELAAFREVGVADPDSALEDWYQGFRSNLTEGPPRRAAQGAVIDSLMRMEADERGLHPAPDVPVAVLLSGELGGSTPPPGMEVGYDYRDYWDVRVRQRIENLDGLALGSPDGLFVVSNRASHFVHFDAPDLVIEAIRHVLFPGVARQLREALEEGGKEALTDTYRALKRRYPPERFDKSLLGRLGYTLLRMEEVESAIAVFELNVEEYPEAPGLYDSLGDAYRAAGRLEAAKRHYERAVALAKEQGHPGLETFRANLKEVTGQIEEQN